MNKATNNNWPVASQSDTASTKLRDKFLKFDVMLNGHYICTLRYKYCPLFPIDSDELEKFILKSRPSLKGKPFNIAF